MSTFQLQETDTTGTVTKTYSLTTHEATSATSNGSTRLDVVPEFKTLKRSTATTSTQSFLTTHIAPLFLPYGYPHTVTADYTPYQIYDSLQAFASSIAGLLSSRAVLQSLGVDSGKAGTSTATYATLLSVARSTISNLSTILFADYMSARISSEVKFYRFLADILNDSGFLLEMISPSLPEVMKVPSLCLSSALRAMCGVAGGSSKAILSAHFAVDGNIGELNAKDGSQETLVNLLGMWVGGVVVSRVESLWATWCWMIVLLSLHLWFNWLAVTSVRLRGLNLGRAGMVFDGLIRDSKCESVDEVGKKERVFEKSGAVRDTHDQIVVTGKVGVGLTEFLRLMGSRQQAGSDSESMENNALQSLLTVFSDERYMLWYSPHRRKALVLLKEGASRDDQLKAWCHAMRLSLMSKIRIESENAQLRLISDTLKINNGAWHEIRRQIEAAGWDMSATVLESTPGTRLKLLANQ